MAAALLLAIDPGREKMGYALLELPTADLPARLVKMGIVPVHEAAELWRGAAAQGETILVVGAGTGSGPVISALTEAGASCKVVKEAFTTVRARARKLRDHPPGGWRRLAPRCFLIPAGPVDDYAALMIAEDWLAEYGAA